MENSIAWFKKKSTSRDVVEALFNRVVKVSTDKDTGEPDGKWPPTMKLKMPRRDNVWEASFIDKSGKVYDINNKEGGDNLEDVLVKNTRMRAIIQCVGLWVASGNYMCQWKLTKAEVEVPDSSGQHEFLDDSDDEDGDGNEAPSNFIEDSNDEDEDGSNEIKDNEEENTEPKVPSPEPEPEPEQSPKKKVVRRKVVKSK